MSERVMRFLRIIGVAWALVVASFGVYQLGRIADAMSATATVVTTTPAEFTALPVQWNDSFSGMGADTKALNAIANAIGTISYMESGLHDIADAIRSLR